MSGNRSGLLTFMSVVMIVIACLQLAGGTFIASVGGFVTLAGAGSQSALLVTLGVLIIATGLIAGIFNLISGILTLQRRGLGFGMFVSIATMVISLVFAIVFGIGGSGFGVAFWMITLIVATLYLIGIIRVHPRHASN